jgi:hypothetical protein
LIVDDDNTYDGSFYKSTLSSNGFVYTYWNASSHFPYSPYDINGIINDMGFNTIVWFSSESQSHFKMAYNYFQSYLNSNNKLIIISGNFINSLRDTIYGGYFSFLKTYGGVDSVYYLDKVYLSRMKLVSANYSSPLQSGSLISYLDGVLIDNSSTEIYHLEDTQCDNFTWNRNPQTGNCDLPIPILAWKKSKLYIFTFPLHKFNSNTNNSQVLIQILNE